MLLAALLIVAILSATGWQQQRPVSNAADQVLDLRFERYGPGYHLVWTYTNPGDYDENGEVNIADLSALGKHLGAKQGAADWVEAQLADGDENGEVNIADVTPIGRGLGSYIEGYQVYGGNSSTGPWEPQGAITLAEAQEDPFEGSLFPDVGPTHFAYLLGTDIDYMHYQVVPYAGDAEGSASEPVSFNSEPPGITNVTPLSGFSGDLVAFQAETSGQLLSYQWEFGGGCEPDTSSFSEPWVTLAEPGDYAASVIVDNEFGEPATFSFTLSISERLGEKVDIVSVGPFAGDSGAAVIFQAEVTGTEPVSYSWNFGGAGMPNTSTSASPEVLLGAVGFYQCLLVANNEHGPPDEFVFFFSVE